MIVEVTPVSREIAGTTYEPNLEQRQRAAALRRFNWLYVYTPILLLSLAALILVGLLLWGVLSPNIEGTSAFVSGLADMIVILFSLPLLLLCAIGPAALIAMIALDVKRRRDPQAASLLQRLHTLLWRLDNIVARVLVKTRELSARVARLVIRVQAGAAYLKAWLNRIKRVFIRS